MRDSPRSSKRDLGRRSEGVKASNVAAWNSIPLTEQCMRIARTPSPTDYAHRYLPSRFVEYPAHRSPTISGNAESGPQALARYCSGIAYAHSPLRYAFPEHRFHLASTPKRNQVTP